MPRVLLRQGLASAFAAALLTALPAWGQADPTTSSTDRQFAALLERLNRHRDGLERSARLISLEEALEQGVQTNPVLRRAYAQIEEADWTLVGIQREWWPSLKADNDDPGLLGWTTTNSQEQVRSASGASQNLVVQSGQASVPRLHLQWTFFDPSRASRSQAALAQISARRFLFQVEARELVLQIQQAYYALQEAFELQHDYKRIYAAVNHLVETGRGAHIDRGQRQQLLTQRLGLLILRIRTHERVIQAADALAQAISLTPGQLAMPADRLEVQGRWDTPLQETITEALRLREEIQVSLSRAGADSWSARARQQRYLPSLFLGGQLSNQNQTLTSGSLLGPSQPTTTWDQEIETQVGLGFDWTLFDGGILSAEAEVLRSRARQSLAQAELDRLSVTRQVQDNHASLINSEIIVQAAADQVQVARQSMQAAGEAYLANRGDATRAVQASNAYRDAAEAYRGAVRKHNTSVAALYRHSARWPEGIQPLLKRAFPRLAAPPQPAAPTAQPQAPKAAAVSPPGPADAP
ncbi:MAG: TolC family protein [Synechococcaceae cyanobacterium]|nr:TolC family protein [Synechococcaceae cyanobacterium]